MEVSDDALLKAVATGDNDALAALLARHGPAVRRRLTISPVWQGTLDAADVMQVTYLEAFLQVHQLADRTPAGFLGWLNRLAENNLRDAIKALERQKRPDPRQQIRRAAPGDSASTLLDHLRGTAQTPSRSVAGHESQQVLETALRQLPPAYAQIVRLHDLEGRPVVEVAEALGRSPGAVYMIRARALQRLQELLGSESRFFSAGA